MSKDMETRDIPRSMKIVLAVIGILTFVNSVIGAISSGLFDAKITQETEIVRVDNLRKNVNDLSSDLDNIDKRVGQSEEDISVLQNEQRSISRKIDNIDRRVEAIYKHIIESQ